MSFFPRLKQKRDSKQGFSSKIFFSSKKIAPQERREVVYLKKNKKSHLGVILLWLLLGATTVYVLFYSPYLLVEKPFVSDTGNIPAARIEQFIYENISGKYFGIVPRNNFFTLRPNRLEEILRQTFPLIKNATVIRTFPNNMRVEIKEREKIVTWCAVEHCFMLEENGTVVENDNMFSDENKDYVLSVTDTSGQTASSGQKIFDWDFAGFVITLESSFNERFGIEIENEFVTTSRFSDGLRVKAKDGLEIFLNARTPLSKSLDVLALLFEKGLPRESRKQLKYIDLRTENRIFYAFQDGAQLEAAEPVVSGLPKIEVKKKKKQ